MTPLSQVLVQAHLQLKEPSILFTDQSHGPKKRIAACLVFEKWLRQVGNLWVVKFAHYPKRMILRTVQNNLFSPGQVEDLDGQRSCQSGAVGQRWCGSLFFNGHIWWPLFLLEPFGTPKKRALGMDPKSPSLTGYERFRELGDRQGQAKLLRLAPKTRAASGIVKDECYLKKDRERETST